MRRTRLGALAALTIVALTALAVAATTNRGESYAFKGGELTPLTAAAPLDLPDTEGNLFSLVAQRGNVVVLYFGYTTCPDACPTTLSDWIAVKEELGTTAERVRFVMVTVDPERDTPAKLQEYLGFFDPAFIGLRGNDEETRAIEAAYGVVSRRVEYPESATKYLVDHTTTTFVIDREGRLRLVYPHGADPADIAEDLRHLL